VELEVVGLVSPTLCVRLVQNTYLSVNRYHVGVGGSVVSEVTIYHNPNCGTSRNVLGLIRNAGIEPTIIEYLKAPPTRETLLGLIKRMGIRVRELLRRKGTPYDELGLDDPKWTDDQLVDAMLANPILINRPIVVTPLGVRLCRPSGMVLEILPAPQRGAFTKEDGEKVVHDQGRPTHGPNR
jgi:arsenate reductase